MKSLIILILACVLSNHAFAYNGGKLSIKVSGNVKNTHYLCVSHVGCVNIYAGRKGRTFPVTPGEISHIFLADGKSYRMHPQELPSSCNIKIDKQETLIVSGKISKTKSNNIYIKQLHCSVVKA